MDLVECMHDDTMCNTIAWQNEGVPNEKDDLCIRWSEHMGVPLICEARGAMSESSRGPLLIARPNPTLLLVNVRLLRGGHIPIPYRAIEMRMTAREVYRHAVTKSKGSLGWSEGPLGFQLYCHVEMNFSAFMLLHEHH